MRYLKILHQTWPPLCLTSVYLTSLHVIKFPRLSFSFLHTASDKNWSLWRPLNKAMHNTNSEVKSGWRPGKKDRSWNVHKSTGHAKRNDSCKPPLKSFFEVLLANQMYTNANENLMYFTCRPPVRSMPVHVEHEAALLVCAGASLCLVYTTAWTWRMYPLWLERWATWIHNWLGSYIPSSFPS